MRASTSFAILTLLAAAGTTFSAPVHHDKADHVARILGDDAPGRSGGNRHNSSHEAHKAQNEKYSKAHAAELGARGHGGDRPGRQGDDRHGGSGYHHRDLVTAQILPNAPLVPGKDGVSDTQSGNLAGHVIQTPGKDKTLADVTVDDGNPAHKTDTKINVPVDGPGSGLTGLNDKNQYGNVVGQLVGKPGKGPGEVVNLPPYAEVAIESKSAAPSKAAHSSTAPKPAKSSNAPKPAQSSHAPKPAQSSHAPKPAQSSSAPKPAQSSAAPKPAQSSNVPKPAQSSHAPKPAQSSHAPKPAQSSTAPEPKPSQHHDDSDGDIDDDDSFYGAGGFLPARPGKGNSGSNGNTVPKPSASSAPHEGNKPSSGTSGHKNPSGGADDEGYTVGLSSSTRRADYNLQYAKVEYGKMPQHVRPCDDLRKGKHGEYLDACIEADMLAYAPKHTVKCPDEMQHEIHYSEDTGKDPALKGKLGKDVAKYVRLCVAAGSL